MYIILMVDPGDRTLEWNLGFDTVRIASQLGSAARNDRDEEIVTSLGGAARNDSFLDGGCGGKGFPPYRGVSEWRL
jgi:hypothetical protein